MLSETVANKEYLPIGGFRSCFADYVPCTRHKPGIVLPVANGTPVELKSAGKGCRSFAKPMRVMLDATDAGGMPKDLDCVGTAKTPKRRGAVRFAKIRGADNRVKTKK